MNKIGNLMTVLLLLGFSISAYNQDVSKLSFSSKIVKKIQVVEHFFPGYDHMGEFALDSVFLDAKEKIIHVHFNKQVSQIPLREHIISDCEDDIKNHLGWFYRNHAIELYSGATSLSDYVPNYYRSILLVDSSHFKTENPEDQVKFIRKQEGPEFSKGLQNKHIALWHSHGKYYESKLDRWEWQRARLHGTVEDLLPMSFVIPYLSKMLENAGAITFIPRERDINRHEIIIDNDGSTNGSELILEKENLVFKKIEKSGFAWKDQYKSAENPFNMGSYIEAKLINSKDSSRKKIATYLPSIPESGEYAIYISWGPNNDSITKDSGVSYCINSQNGNSCYSINQSIGANTWIYLGHFFFTKGKDADNGSIEIFSKGKNRKVTLDAIRLGGGMGNIARRQPSSTLENVSSIHDRNAKKKFSKNRSTINHEKNKWKVSGVPRYMEAARYFLQYSGMPDSSVYSLNQGKNDYNDDYQGRGEWVNYLMGTSSNLPDSVGLGIPIDLSFAFHTDAGVAGGDTIIGTLGIYSSETNEGIFPNGRSKSVNRELTDMIQSQIVGDIKSLNNPGWTRRAIWNREYSEAYRANVPSMLLELLSHQNLADMEYALDPSFRFNVSRAIYKGMLRFLSYYDGQTPVVQPLPVNHFSIERLIGKKIRLRWKAVEDPLEDSADPNSYLIYMRKNNEGFKLIQMVGDTSVLDYELPGYNTIFSFKIVAKNKGGISFPSEILSVGIPIKSVKTALIVNAFDRICGPATFDTDSLAGLALWKDHGVADKYEFAFVGFPYDFSRNSPWLDDDSPGWGASHADWEGRIIPGNSFDNTYIHGKGIMDAGLAFVSMSDESFERNQNLDDIDLIDIIFGEEKTTNTFNKSKEAYKIFTKEMMGKIIEVKQKAIPLFMSGAYIGSDAVEHKDSIAVAFMKDVLHYKWRSNFADKMGRLSAFDQRDHDWSGNWTFNTGFHEKIYTVEAPDAIEPVGEGAVTIFRYSGSGSSAACAYSGIDQRVIIFGFPFETIMKEENRSALMTRVIDFLIER